MNRARDFTPSDETLAIIESKVDVLRQLAANPPPEVAYYSHDDDTDYDRGFRAGWIARMKCEKK